MLKPGPLGTEWRIETWYEMSGSTSEWGDYVVRGYFTDQETALAARKGAGWWGSDGKVSEVLVLTRDGKRGYVLSDEVATEIEKEIRKEIARQAREKLTPEERNILGID